MFMKKFLTISLCLFLMLSTTIYSQPKGYLAGKGVGQYHRDTLLKPIPNLALTELHRGMTFGFLAKNGYFSSTEGLAQIDKMANLGIKWVSLVVILMQETPFSTRVYSDYTYTASDGELEMAIDEFHKRDIRVMLYTDLEMHDSNWRGLINFPKGKQQIQGITTDYWTPWFESYTAAMVNYARLCQRKGVELLGLGAEMDGTVNENDQWLKLISTVRKVYAGPLLYEVHGDINFDSLPTWYSKLDLIGYSFYGGVANKLNATAEEMKSFLQPRVEKMKRLSDATGKPLIFSESGALSRKGATMSASSWQKSGEYDGDEQAKFLEAVLSAFWNEKWWRGLYWWKWDEQQYRPQLHSDPKGDQTFTIDGKPAANTMKKWYSRKDR